MPVLIRSIFNVPQIVNYYRVHKSVYSDNENVIVKCGGKDWRKADVLSR